MDKFASLNVVRKANRDALDFPSEAGGKVIC